MQKQSTLPFDCSIIGYHYNCFGQGCIHTDSTGSPAIVGPNQMDGKYRPYHSGRWFSYVSFRLTLEHSNAALWTLVLASH